MHDAALQLHKEGCVVVPAGSDKRPLVRWRRWYSLEQTRRHVHEYWNAYPDADVAIVLGAPSKLVVFDVEQPAYEAGALRSLLVPMTPTARSRSGGRHLYFQYDSKLRTTNWLFDGQHAGELRSDYSLVMAPPSRGYDWIHSPFDVELNEPPLELERVLRADEAVARTRDAGGYGGLSAPFHAPHRRSRSEGDFALATYLILAGMDEAIVVAAIAGGEKASEKSSRDRASYARRTVAKASERVRANAGSVRVVARGGDRHHVELTLKVIEGTHGARVLRVRIEHGKGHAVEESLAATGSDLFSIRTGQSLRALLDAKGRTVFVNALVRPVASGRGVR